MDKYIPIIGLEIHVELKTKSKMFCQCSADYFGKKPNSNTCPVCLGLPGSLPVPNYQAVEWCILIGKALNCKIPFVSKFDRKNYFYPDLAKGYQISQYDEPIAKHGWLNLKAQNSNRKSTMVYKKFRIRRVHLEEDTGKLIHLGSETLIDFNRSGVPLVEIVTEPDFNNVDDVKLLLEELQVIIRYLGVSDADMEKGSMRLEPNISITQIKDQKSKTKDIIKNLKLPKYKVEIKNINSFRFVKQAIEYEAERQTSLLNKGITLKQETRGFDEKKRITYSQRVKEEAHDYRYFPEPDIPPLNFDKKNIDSLIIPELPQQKLEKYVDKFGLRYQDAFLLTRDFKKAVQFEILISKLNPSTSSGLTLSEGERVKTQNFRQKVANLIINNKINLNSSLDVNESIIIRLLSPKKTDEKLLETTIDRIIETNQKAVNDYKNGKENALMFLVGQIMREMKGKADAKIVMSNLKFHLKS